MSEWRFSDGTVVTSEGKVTGTSDFAAFCAYDVDRVKDGLFVGVDVGPHPSRQVPLKLGDDDIMARWLMMWTYGFKVRLISGPLPVPQDVQYQHVPGRIY